MCECTGRNRLGENDFFSEVGEREKKNPSSIHPVLTAKYKLSS